MSAQRNNAGLFARFIPVLFLIVMLYILIAAVSTVVKVLYSWLAIPLLLIALVLNYSVVTDYFAGIMQDLKEDTGKGLIKAAATAVGYPFVFAYLALKAWTKRALGSKRPSVKKQKQKKEDYIKYEEVEDDDFLDLEDLDKAHEDLKVKQTRTKADNDYEDLFE